MVASPYLLHKIGLKFARSILDKNLNPEQKLWREVVINAFDETLILQSDRKSSLIKISAHNWIIGGDKDFYFRYDKILLVDDVLTSGKTITKLQKSFPNFSCYFITLADAWLTRR